MAFTPVSTGNVDTINFDGQIVTVEPGDFWLSASGGGNSYTTFRTLAGSGVGGQYQIPDATNLRIIGVRVATNSATDGTINIGYGDTSVINGGAPTNPVYIGGANVASNSQPFFGFGRIYNFFFVDWVIDAATTPGKFPFLTGDIGWRGFALCREETP